MPRLAVVVSYCSNERPFVRALVRQALLVGDAVLVSVGERLYTGEPEDEAGLAALAAEFPAARFVRYPVPDAMLSAPIALHNLSRSAAVDELRRNVCSDDDDDDDDWWVLLLDGDEVPDASLFGAWWRALAPAADAGVAYKLANYWYFLHPRLRAGALEDSVVLLHLRHLTPDALAHPRERDGVLFVALEAGLARVDRMVLAPDGRRAMFHHYSWVRRRAALFAKVANWGHSRDRDWVALLRGALVELDAGRVPREFVHGYPLEWAPSPDPAVAPDLALLSVK
jgi:hypothetical protein